MAETPEYPQSRDELWLNEIAGGLYDTTPEEPQSRIEKWLAYIAEHGGGGGSSIITDETTGKKYEHGMRDGRLFVEEVES